MCIYRLCFKTIMLHEEKNTFSCPQTAKGVNKDVSVTRNNISIYMNPSENISVHTQFINVSVQKQKTI